MTWYCMVACLLAAAAPDTIDLAAPVQVRAGDEPINVDMGHAAPFVADLKGDGRLVLLVGQFGDGKLRLYPNLGTRTAPRFEKFEWFQVDGQVVTLPTG